MNDVLIPENGWILNETMLPVPDLDRQLWFKISASVAKILGRNEVPDIFKMLSINQNIFWRWLLFASRLMPYGQLPDRERELIILRVAWLCRSRYEWGQHIEIGQKRAKLSDRDIVNIASGADNFSELREQLLLKACDEFIENKTIDTKTWKALKNFYNDKLMLEINMLIGHYQMLAGVLNSSGLKLEPVIEQYVREFNDRIRIIV